MLLITLFSFVLVFVLIGFFGFIAIGIWWLIDAFLIYGIVNDYNLRLAHQLAR